MRTRTERLKNRGEQLRAQGLSVSATLQLYAGAVADQERSKAIQIDDATVAEEGSR